MALSTDLKEKITNDALVHWNGGNSIVDVIKHAIAATESWVSRHIDGKGEGYVLPEQSPYEAALAANANREIPQQLESLPLNEPDRPGPRPAVEGFRDSVAGAAIDPNTVMLEKDRIAAQKERDEGGGDPLTGFPEGRPRETMNYDTLEGGRTVGTTAELTPPASDGSVMGAGTEATMDEELRNTNSGTGAIDAGVTSGAQAVGAAKDATKPKAPEGHVWDGSSNLFVPASEQERLSQHDTPGLQTDIPLDSPDAGKAPGIIGPLTGDPHGLEQQQSNDKTNDKETKSDVEVANGEAKEGK